MINPLPITEVIKRKEEELEQLREDAWTKYRTRKIHKLREKRNSGDQQFADKKALAFQIETTASTLTYLRQLASTTQFVVRNEPTLNLNVVNDEGTEEDK